MSGNRPQIWLRTAASAPNAFYYVSRRFRFLRTSLTRTPFEMQVLWEPVFVVIWIWGQVNTETVMIIWGAIAACALFHDDPYIYSNLSPWVKVNKLLWHTGKDDVVEHKYYAVNCDDARPVSNYIIKSMERQHSGQGHHWALSPL